MIFSLFLLPMKNNGIPINHNYIISSRTILTLEMLTLSISKVGLFSGLLSMVDGSEFDETLISVL